MTRVAIAGIGVIADFHARAVTDIRGADLVAGSCRTESDGRAFAEEHDCDWYADTETMLDDAAPDVLTVCTPSGAHLRPTVAAAERGIDVLCEKPLEVTPERINEMIAAAEANDVCLGGIFDRRFEPALRRVHEAASAGRFGDLAICRAHVPWWRDDDYYTGSWQGTEALDGGGAFMNQAIHGVDAIQWLAGAASDCDPATNPVESVFACTDTLAHEGDMIEVEDTGVAVLRFRDGTLGQVLAATSMYPGSEMEIQLSGRDGTAAVADGDLQTWTFRDGSDGDGDAADDGQTDPDPTEAETESYAAHRRNIQAFLDARQTSDAFGLRASEARKAVDIVAAIYESAERNAPVSVDGT